MPAVVEHLLFYSLLVTLSHGRTLPKLTSFDRELTFHDKRVIVSSTPEVVTDLDSYLYAVCSSQEKTFKKNRCNVTIETPAFVNATYRDTCALTFTAERHLESLTNLQLQPYGDDKVLLSWGYVHDDDLHPRGAVVRVLRIGNCRYLDVSIPADNLRGIVTYDNSFDVIFSNKTYCGCDSCRLTFDSEGKKIGGPVKFLPNVKFSSLSTIISAVPRSSSKGFYVIAYGKAGLRNPFVLQASADGKGTELLKAENASILTLSNAYDALSACWTTGRTNVTCKQYDTKQVPLVKLNAINGFLDEKGHEGVPTRWIQQHNLREGGLLLATGEASGQDQRRLERFTVIRLHPDGSRDRPLEVDGLDFECTSLRQFRVNVAENDDDEICFHFVCDRNDFDRQGIRNTIKYTSKCLPEKYVVMIKRKAAVVN